MASPTQYSEAILQVLKLAKKTALALGKGAQAKYGGAVPVEGWELLNALHLLQPTLVESCLGPVLRERNLGLSHLPWVDVAPINDQDLDGKSFRMVRLDDGDYLVRAARRADGKSLELRHLLETLMAAPDQSLTRILDARSHYQKLRDFLRSRIIGQDAAIDTIIEGLKVSRLRLNQSKPFSFALLGPTGVGKTETVKQLANFLFGEDNEKKHLLSINLSRYQMDTAHELIFGGSPYKGQPESGLLFPFLKQLATKVPGTANDFQVNRSCIILLDEIEKAHYSTFMGFLNLLDDGVVETIDGRSHCRFHLSSEALVFLTSNAGASLYEDATIGSHFLQNPEVIKQALQQESQWAFAGERKQTEGISSSGHGFRPEFLGRIDAFTMFSRLQPSQMEQIAWLNLQDLAARVRKHEAFKTVEQVEFDPALATLFAFKDGFQYGVRNLKSLIETSLIPPLITAADQDQVQGVTCLRVAVADDDFRHRMGLDAGQVRVLAIDDPGDLSDPDDYRNHFADLNLTWDPAPSLEEALKLLKKQAYTFILMDLDPRILKQIRRRFPSIPVFIFSDTATEEDKNRVLQSGGARDFLRKDLDETEIQRQLSVFQQLALDQNRIASLKSTLAGQANGLCFAVSEPRRVGATLQLSIGDIRPTYTPRTDDLGLYTQRRKAVALDEVQGIDSFRDQITELVEILKAPQDYLSLGATLPKGILLHGPPGTGKTMLAQALAHETGLPFLYTSSGTIAGQVAVQGERAVSSLFAQVRRNAPCVVFIDEIDGIGQVRVGLSASTLLQSLLTGLDSIRHHEQVLFVAATNRPEVLDPALTRPGRFDRKFAMEPPNLAGREAILRTLLDSFDCSGVDIGAIARLTFGFTGAQLTNLLNEAALAAKRKRLDSITQEVLEEVIDLVKFGPETRTLTRPEDRRQTAVHELGHGIVTVVLKTNPLHRISLISRSNFLGISEALPDENRRHQHRDYWLHRIAVALGGRAAEELVYGSAEGQTPGVESDLEQATWIATQMVCRWGMVPELRGCFLRQREDYLGQSESRSLFFSESTAKAIDQAIQQILHDAARLARATLEPYQPHLADWARRLMEQEELTGNEVVALIHQADRAVGLEGGALA